MTSADGSESARCVVGRFAPSPTGDLHLGSAFAALAAWQSARRQGGRFILRVEDLDGPRVVPGSTDRQMEDLRWLGIDWDEGPDVGGPHGPYRQSERGATYEEALARLAAGGHIFPCQRSRKDLRELASAPHGSDGLPPYRAAWRPSDLAPNWYAALGNSPDCALRFRAGSDAVRFADRVLGEITEDVSTAVGDFVLKRRDGMYAYQLAVVVDDLAMGVTEVVRGADLVDSTARQIQLIRALGGEVPAYTHVPMLVAEDGAKLSKRNDAQTIRSLRERGVAPEAVLDALAFALERTDGATPIPAAALIDQIEL